MLGSRYKQIQSCLNLLVSINTLLTIPHTAIHVKVSLDLQECTVGVSRNTNTMV